MTDQAEAPAGTGTGPQADPRAVPRPDPPRSRRARLAAARRRSPLTAFAREVAIVVLGALGLSWVITTFLAQAFFIPSSSMHDTLREGDRVVVNKLAPGPFDLHRGDVVVFADPGGWLDDAPETSVWQDVLATTGLAPRSEDHLIKRIIGLPGDRVVAAGDGSPLTVNGVAVDETRYLAAGASPSEIRFDVTVPDGAVWLMGDNRQRSRDSRWHLGDPGGGSVSVDDVVGTAFAIVLPFDRAALLRNPGAVFADVPAPS